MSVLEIENLKFSYGDKNLFNSLNMRLFNNDHLGLIGMNGVGKTTLLNLISRRLSPDEGRIIWSNNISFSYLDQHLKVEDSITVYDYLYKVYDDLFKIEDNVNRLYKSLETADVNDFDKILNRAANLTEELETSGFYMIKSKIDNVINGLGIKVDNNFLLKNLSGGERMKIFLAKMLLEEKDVLLLDEPTNFLDIVHVEWLSKYLVNYPKAYIVISHNTDFLNNVTNVIGEIHNKQLNLYKGNYESYLKQKELQDKQYLDKYLAQQKYIKKTEDFIKRNIARASTSGQAKSRRKNLEKLDVLEKPVNYKNVKFDFPFSHSFNKEAVIVKDLEIGYDQVLLPKINLEIRFGERIAIIGKNGVGKTTFLKTLLNIIPPISGKIGVSDLNKIVYYSQEFKGNKNVTPVEYIQNEYPLMDNNLIRSLLARYGISGELALKNMDKLSGGEITKVRFALLSLSDSNLLILDEPTNHLDVIAKSALYTALKEYSGTVILVSHEKEIFQELKMKEIKFG